MPGHDPVQVANLLKSQESLAAEGAELLQLVGDKAPVYFDIGVDEVLVALQGWAPIREPADFLVVVPKYA